MDAALPTTFEKYTVRWPRFPTSICEFLTEFDRFAPADARLRLLSVLACEWDREYGQHLGFDVICYHKDKKNFCQHG